MSKSFDALIVGAGHGGAATAIALRQRRFPGTVAIVGDEAVAPYERPPLSKEYLSGERSFDRILIRPATFWAEREISLFPGRKVVALNAQAHTVQFSDGDTFGFGKLIWAAGGQARRLTCSGHDLAGVHTVRNRADVDGMMHELSVTRRVVVIGGGYIGLEAAAVLCKLGKHVTVLEALDRVLARVAGEPLSRFFETEHRARGVDVRLNTQVECIEERNGRAVGVRIRSGDVIPADMVIVGIGIAPVVAPLLTAGAEGGNGVLVDGHCRTSLADIHAIGDCALHSNAFARGSLVRIESVQNATDMAGCVAKTVTGEPEPYRAVPWFWSHQYDLRLQTVGLSMRHDEVIVRGEMKSRSFSVVYRREGRVIALDCVNASKDYVQGRALVLQGAMS